MSGMQKLSREGHGESRNGQPKVVNMSFSFSFFFPFILTKSVGSEPCNRIVSNLR